MRGSPSRAINKGLLTFTRPVFPSPTQPGWNQPRFGFPPELRTPPSPATHVRGRDRPPSTDLELPLNSHASISNPAVHSMRATSRRTANGRCAATRGPRLAFASAGVSRAWCRGWLCPRSDRRATRCLREERGCLHANSGSLAETAAWATLQSRRAPGRGRGKRSISPRPRPPSFGLVRISGWV